jgi:signal transduction histidine kinase
LGLLSATVAHDLRNPMNTLSMAVADLPAEAKAVARRQLDRMDSLVRDLLDYGKPWALAPEPVDAMALVGDLDPEVDRVPATGPTTLRADPARLRQALANLLDNARAAGGRVQVAMTEEAGTGAPLLHLRDDGQGIPEDIRPRLFQPFISRGEGTPWSPPPPAPRPGRPSPEHRRTWCYWTWSCRRSARPRPVWP